MYLLQSLQGHLSVVQSFIFALKISVDVAGWPVPRKSWKIMEKETRHRKSWKNTNFGKSPGNKAKDS